MFPSAQRIQYCICLEYGLVLASDNKFGSIPALQVDDRGLIRWKSDQNQRPWPPDFNHFLNGLDLDHRPGVRESIQICCHLPEQVYTPSRNNTGSVGHSETWFAQHTSSYPPPQPTLKIYTFICGATGSSSMHLVMTPTNKVNKPYLGLVSPLGIVHDSNTIVKRTICI